VSNTAATANIFKTGLALNLSSMGTTSGSGGS
jgi:hypothetical protein